MDMKVNCRKSSSNSLPAVVNDTFTIWFRFSQCQAQEIHVILLNASYFCYPLSLQQNSTFSASAVPLLGLTCCGCGDVPYCCFEYLENNGMGNSLKSLMISLSLLLDILQRVTYLNRFGIEHKKIKKCIYIYGQ